MTFARYFLTITQASFIPLGFSSFNAKCTSGTAAPAAGNRSPINNTRSTTSDSFDKQSGFLKKKTTQTHTESDSSNSIGSTFTGTQVLVGAGNNANIQGSNLVSDTLTWVDAKNNVNITSATNTVLSVPCPHLSIFKFNHC